MAWVSAQREKIKDEGGWRPDEYLRCDTCPLTGAERAEWNCGFLPVEQRTGRAPVPPRAPASDVCPGYTSSLPEVGEACRALSWADRGMLRDFYAGDELSPIVFDAIDILQSAISSVERDGIRELRSKSRSSGG